MSYYGADPLHGVPVPHAAKAVAARLRQELGQALEAEQQVERLVEACERDGAADAANPMRQHLRAFVARELMPKRLLVEALEDAARLYSERASR